MKRILFIIVMGLCFNGAFSQNESHYIIKGTMRGIADGNKVFLQKNVGNNLVVVDSTVIEGNSFIFKGTSDPIPSVYYVTYFNNGYPVRSDFYLENGTIRVDMSMGSINVTGTPCNNAFQKFKDSCLVIMNGKKDLFKQDISLLNEKEKEQIANQYNLIKELYISTIRENVRNKFGIDLLVGSGDLFEFSELESLVAQVPAMYASAPEVKALQTKIQLEGPMAVGKKFTDFTMNTPEGKSVKLSDFVSQNEYTLVDFWASWCGPCRAEMPNVVKAYEQFKAKGFGIVGVSLDSDAEAWKKGISDLNITWAQMSDLKGWDCEGAKLYGVRSIPSTVLINKEGVIVARNLRAEALHNKLSELLK